jgi:hypothetical protein
MKKERLRESVELLHTQERTDIPISYSSDYCFIENANGIKYLYAWLDKHPYVRAVVNM